MKFDWEGYFLPYILERAQKCVREHRVKSIQRTKAGYEATVQGEKEYHVVIEKEKDKINNMNCNCFYVKKRGKYCKHMAAVLYELETEEKLKEEKRQSNLYEVKDIISKMSRKEMQNFLYTTAKEFPNFDKELRFFTVGHNSREELERQKQEIDQIIFKYTDCYGLVYDQTEYLLIGEIEAFFQERINRMIGHGNEKAAAELITYSFEQLSKIGIEDRGGVFLEFTNFCTYNLEQILKQKQDSEIEKQIYEWIQKIITEEIPETVKERLYDFIMEHFKEIMFLERKLILLNEKIEREERIQETSKKRKLGSDLAKRLQIMEQLSFPEKECTDYRMKFWNVPEIRQMEIRKQMEKGEYTEAEKLITESIKMDQNLLECQEKYSRQLAEIYWKQGKRSDYQRQLIEYFLNYHQDSVELWRKIRTTFSEEKWEKEREKILQEIHLPYCRYQIMAEEKMFLSLIEELKKEKILEFLDQYERVLKRKFPEEMLRLYADCLVCTISKIKGREKYREIAAHLEKMKNYPGGSKIVDEITADWKKRYRNRKALIEELEKLE